MKTIRALATVVALSGLVGVAEAQLTRTDSPGPVRPAAPQGPRESASSPEARAPKDRSLRIEIDGIDGILRAVALDQDFSIGDTSGRRLPQAIVTLTRESDEYTAALLRGHARGTRFRDVTITSQPGSTGKAKSIVKLTDVVVESVRIRTTDDGAEEAVILRFGKVAWSDAEGNSFEWNYATMTPR